MAIKTHTAKSLMALAMAEQKQVEALDKEIKRMTKPLEAQIAVTQANMNDLIEHAHRLTLAKKKLDWKFLLAAYPTSDAKYTAFVKTLTDLGLTAVFCGNVWKDTQQRVITIDLQRSPEGLKHNERQRQAIKTLLLYVTKNDFGHKHFGVFTCDECTEVEQFYFTGEYWVISTRFGSSRTYKNMKEAFAYISQNHYYRS
jgi:hypothetical protein